MEKYTVAVIVGVIAGVLGRLYMLRTDYRQYPTYPHGRVIHLSLGIIASGLGAIAVPALLEEEYTAITFLGVAAQQFRDVRNMERNTLQELDEMELVPRGSSYIEGIAMVFEGRNYLVIFTSFLVSLSMVMWSWAGAALAFAATFLITTGFMSGKILGQLANIKTGEVRMEGPDLYVDDIYIMNIGLHATQDVIRERGVGIVLSPKNENSLVTIANIGQRQAILHDVSTVLGVYRDTGEPSLVPLAKRDLENGDLGIFLLPQDQDIDKVTEVISKVPVLESAVRMPSEASANK